MATPPPKTTSSLHNWKTYCADLSQRTRLKTREVNIGGVGFGGDNPISVQSMTTTDTMDTQATVEQSIRMIEAGCELVRITAPTRRDAENLENIKRELRARGYDTPIVADIHFTPNAAEIAARIVEKVRVNPGNYADKKKFEVIEYTDAQYAAEIERIYERFSPLVKICKQEGVAMRIGTNHGSLSDRILSRYGDTPEGMVESALEFIRICEDHDYRELVISMKASNTRVMVAAYRLLVNKLMARDGDLYPLHLGVTEAGDGDDGRIKSAIGISTLLADGIGDTVRVSLTEPPEAEMPVGYYLVNHIERRIAGKEPVDTPALPVNPYEYQRRPTRQITNFGSEGVPRIIADFSHKPLEEKDLLNVGHYYSPSLDKWHMTELGTDYVYLGSTPSPFMLPNGLRAIYDQNVWVELENQSNAYPRFESAAAYLESEHQHPTLNFITENAEHHNFDALKLIADEPVVVILSGAGMHSLRAFMFRLMQAEVNLPVVLQHAVRPLEKNAIQTIDHQFMLTASTELGQLLVDGLVDGLMLTGSDPFDDPELWNRTAFNMLQASRSRMTKTEYISCPSCGRTLFDLEETTAMIRSRTDHLKGVKIGIMGCIVNGPGEMADADYGYVGSGKGKITLYRGQEVVKRQVPSEQAVDELIKIIDEDGNWFEPVRE